MPTILDDESANYELFRDILATPLIEKCSSQPQPAKARRKRRGRKNSVALEAKDISYAEEASDAEDLAEFIDYLALETFTSLPPILRTLSYTIFINTPNLQKTYASPISLSTTGSILESLPPTVTDSLTTYNLLPSTLSTAEFFRPVLELFISSLTETPPSPSQSKCLSTGCEICLRPNIPLTYHHLIPRSKHTKALVRKWHTKDQLANVAWLCRACHSFVHGLASNEELARDLYTIERLMEREETRRWASWVGRVRWRKR